MSADESANGQIWADQRADRRCRGCSRRSSQAEGWKHSSPPSRQSDGYDLAYSFAFQSLNGV